MTGFFTGRESRTMDSLPKEEGIGVADGTSDCGPFVGIGDSELRALDSTTVLLKDAERLTGLNPIPPVRGYSRSSPISDTVEASAKVRQMT
jgi:hypothetical protein